MIDADRDFDAIVDLLGHARPEDAAAVIERKDAGPFHFKASLRPVPGRGIPDDDIEGLVQCYFGR